MEIKEKAQPPEESGQRKGKRRHSQNRGNANSFRRSEKTLTHMQRNANEDSTVLSLWPLLISNVRGVQVNVGEGVFLLCWWQEGWVEPPGGDWTQMTALSPSSLQTLAPGRRVSVCRDTGDTGRRGWRRDGWGKLNPPSVGTNPITSSTPEQWASVQLPEGTRKLFTSRELALR